MRRAANHVYVIAPDSDLKVSEGGLHGSKPTGPRCQRHPLGVLFSSLAVDQRERPIAIVLSGMRSNARSDLQKASRGAGVAD